MSSTTKISQEIKDALQDAIKKKLFILPAFRLKEKQAKVLKKYALRQLNVNISKIKFNSKSFESIVPSALDRFSHDSKVFLYPLNFQGLLRIKLTYSMMPKITWIKFVGLILSFLAIYWLNRQVNIWFTLPKIIFLLLLPFVFISFGFDVLKLYNLVTNTLNFLDRISKEVQYYVENIFLTNEQEEELTNDIESLSNKVVKEFIHEEIRQLDYKNRKIHIFTLFFAFSISFIVVYVTGNTFVILIKDFAKLINLLPFFPLINDLNVQTFWLIFLFPLSIALARDLIIEVSQKYSKDLHRSLFLIKLHEEVYIKKIGNTVILIAKDNPWQSLVDSLDQFSDDFMITRDQPPLDNRETF